VGKVVTILAIWAAGLGAAAQFGKISVLYDLLAVRYGDHGAVALGLMVSVVGLVGLVFGTTAGILVSRVGPRRAMVAALVMGAVVSLGQAVLPHWPVMMALRVVEGVSHLAIVVVGPTASGKSALAMALSERLGGEIVSADSMQVYRHMDIGTAKPTREERARVRHHLIDVVNPDESFNVAQFKELADATVRKLSNAGRPAIVTGGTGLYVKVLLHGIFPAPKVDPDLRRRLYRESEVYGPEYLHERLVLIDPSAAEKIARTDLVRVVRALEIHEQTGIPLSEHQLAHSFHGRDYEALHLGLDLPRDTLYRRVEERVDQMMADGFLDEVKSLLDRGFAAHLKPMQALGYKQLAEHLGGECTLDEAVRKTKRETKRYAKRQLTWFKSDPIEWVDPKSDLDALAARCRTFLENR